MLAASRISCSERTLKPVRPMPVSSFMWHLSGAPEPPRRRLTARAQLMSPIACSAGSRAISPAMNEGLGASISTGAVTPAARSSAASS